MNKYVCPECGSNLKVLHEHVFDKVQNINPKTGLLGKRVTKNLVGRIDTCTTIKCANRNCRFDFYDGYGHENNYKYKEFQDLLDKIKMDENYQVED